MKVEIGSRLATLLTCIFVIAKLWGKIDWSWWWIFSPLWISLIVGILIVTIIFILQ
jgi:hypothetical protein